MDNPSSQQTPKLRFMKPSEDITWEEDKPDIEPTNETTFIFNPYISLSLLQQRQRLPVAKYREDVLYLLETHQVVVLVGETGSGKSTQIPQFLVEAGWTSDGKIIGITQPRRVAATSLASRVADESGSILGDEVGYSIRFDDKVDPQRTRIKYMTEGILIQEMMADPLLRSYSVIMLDEIHERTLNSDILMGLLRKIIKKRKDLKLVVSSATVDAEELKSFFNTKTASEGRGKKDTGVILSMEGRSHPIEIYHSLEPVPDYIRETVETALKIHETEGPGDILVFLTGQEEVDRAVTLMEENKSRSRGRSKLELLILPMYGSLPPRDQLKVFHSTPRDNRKIVFATNIAETSITIPGIVYVIDCGFVKMRWFNPDTFTDSLVVVPISQASATQRAGRAGRVRPGKVYRLFPESEYNKLPKCSPPEIQRMDLSCAILKLKALGIDNIVHFNFPSPPPPKNLVSAVELLFALGALDGQGDLTKPIGEQMAELPMVPTFSKLILSSGEFGCSEEIITIVAMLQVESVFQTPFGQLAAKARIERRKFEVGEGDLITLLNVFNAFMKSGGSKQFCNKHFLHYKRLKRALELRNQMMKTCSKLDIPLVSSGYDSEAVLKCITAGFFPNAVYLHYTGVYHTVRGDQPVHIHPTSVLYTLPQPQWMVFAEIIHTNQIYVRDLTVVKPEWLKEAAPHFYTTITEKNH